MPKNFGLTLEMTGFIQVFGEKDCSSLPLFFRDSEILQFLFSRNNVLLHPLFKLAP